VESPGAFLADTILFVHSLYVAFTLGGAFLILAGGFLKWHWVRNRVFRLLHLAAVLFVALESLLGVDCFLTRWEYALRAGAGQFTGGDISFVGRIIGSLIYIELPDWGFVLLYSGFALFILVLYLLFPPEKGPGPRGD